MIESKPDKDLEMYCALMSEVKNRMNSIREVYYGHTSTLYSYTNIEFMCLQIREILELISMGSLVVNQEEFEMIEVKYSKFWNAKLILQDIERLNPCFYPIPVRELQASNREGIKEIQHKESGYLTREDFVEVYDKCGRILHAQNPFGSKLDYGLYSDMVRWWSTLIIELLGIHLIKLKGGDSFYLIHMEESDRLGVHGYCFEKC